MPERPDKSSGPKSPDSSHMLGAELRSRMEISGMDGPWQLECFQHGAKIFSHMNIFVLLNGAGRAIGYQNTGTGLPISLPVEPPVQGEESILRPTPNPSVVAIWQRR